MRMPFDAPQRIAVSSNQYGFVAIRAAEKRVRFAEHIHRPSDVQGLDPLHRRRSRQLVPDLFASPVSRFIMQPVPETGKAKPTF